MIPPSSTPRPSGARFVHDVLRERILSLELKPGARLYEAELARELGVSRTPLREALRTLVAEELLVQRPTGGMVVPALDAEDMRQLYVVRATLEGLLVREACERMDVDTDADLAGQISHMALLVDHPRDLRRLGQEFHARLAETSGNQRGQQLLHQIQRHVARYQMLTNLQSPRRTETLTEHRGIYEAVLARDADLAEQRMREHIMNAYRTAAAVLDSAPGD